jgi:DNA-binding NarL/FixJ family response regulator
MKTSNIKIIELLAAGYLYKQIAAELGMQTRTVKFRIKEMKKQHKCHTVTQLAVKIITQLHQRTAD